MTIKFICSCGKHLKARDNMAARRSVCPRCGSPVGIPSLKPTHAGTVAAPMTPAERQRRTRERAAASVSGPSPADAVISEAPRPLDTRLVRLVSARGPRQPNPPGRILEQHWHECLLYPLRAWHLYFGAALLMSVLSAVMVALLPRFLAEPPADPLMLRMFHLMCVLLLVLLVGIPCSFLECVLTSATAGEVYYIRLSAHPLVVVMLSGAKWLACFAAGPVIFASAAWYYWLQCGDPHLLDWLILGELGIATISYWMFALLSVSDRGRWRDLNPVAVVDLAHRLGWRALAVVVAAALLFLGHGLVLVECLEVVRDSKSKGLLLLACVWVSGLFWSTFFCRLLGIWCHLSRQPLVESVDTADRAENEQD